MRHRLLALTLIAVFGSAFFVGRALAIGPYLGSGHFPTASLTWDGSDNAPADYLNARGGGFGNWDSYTHLSISRSTNWKVFYTIQYNGATGWNGYAFICNTLGTCDNSSAWSGTYRDCNVWINRSYMDADTAVQKWNIAAHELGHCWSLAHNTSDQSSLMWPYLSNVFTPNSNDVASVNARY